MYWDIEYEKNIHKAFIDAAALNESDVIIRILMKEKRIPFFCFSKKIFD